MARLKIYIAGPLNNPDAAKYLQNVSKMLKVADAIRRKGHSPFVPCMDLLLGIVAGDMEYNDYWEMNLPWIEGCDALFFIDHSPGADRELELARKLGKKVFMALNQVPVNGGI